MKRVLVTGATGFIGRQTLQPLLDVGYDVHATSYRSSGQEIPGVSWHRTDLLDPRAIRELLAAVKPSHLLHFAWYAIPGKYPTSPENLRWCQATLELAQVFCQGGGKRAVFAGTCFEYDSHYGFCQEELTPSNPSTLYGICKKGTMEVLLGFARQAGLSAAWGRIFYLYGPFEAEQRLVPSVILSLLAGKTARCSHGRQVRDFMHVADVASAFVALLESDVAGVVNIGSGVPVSIRELVEHSALLIGAKDRVEFGAVAAPPDDPPLLLADTRKLTSVLNWRPRTSLDDGLAQTIAWWRDARSGQHC
jgi:nucleoside-diphosphate-sugar epimerase